MRDKVRACVAMGCFVVLSQALGCAETCDGALARYRESYRACGMSVDDPGGADCGGLTCEPDTEQCNVTNIGGGYTLYECAPRSCSSAEAKYYSCNADCVAAASCETLKNADKAGQDALQQCFFACQPQ